MNDSRPDPPPAIQCYTTATAFGLAALFVTMTGIALVTGWRGRMRG